MRASTAPLGVFRHGTWALLALWLLGACLPLAADEPAAAPAAPTDSTGPTDLPGAQKTLLGVWTVDKESFRKAILKGMAQDNQPLADGLRKLVEEVLEKSQMTLQFQPDGKLSTTARMVSPLGGPPVETKESGTWKVTGVKDMVFTVETVTVESEGGEKQTEEVQVRFAGQDRLQLTIPLQKVELTFVREKK